jgi:Tol biopolymer transport system component
MKMIVSFLVKLLSYIALLVFFFLSSVFPQQLSLTQLTFSDSTHDGYPYWTPDGKYIFYSSGSKRSCTTMKISSDGGEPVKMTEYFSQHAQVSLSLIHI